MLILNGRLCCTNENLLEFVISKQLSGNQTHNLIKIYLKLILIETQ